MENQHQGGEQKHPKYTTRVVNKTFLVSTHDQATPTTPVVVIIAWIGCDYTKYLKTYLKWFHDRNYLTIATRPSELYHFYPPKMRDYAATLLRTLTNLKLKQNPIFFQGNMTLYSQVVDIISTEKEFSPLLPRVAGQIFDSTPNDITEEGALKSLTQGASWPLYAVCWTSCRAFATVVDVPKINEEYNRRLDSSKITAPAIFFYSVDDPLIDYRGVENFIKKVQAKGISTTVVRWETSVHVQHIRQHYEEYSNQLEAFLLTSLDQWNQTQPQQQPSIQSKL